MGYGAKGFSVFKHFGDSARVPWFFARAWLMAPAVEAGLRLAGLKRTLAAVERLSGTNSSEQSIDIERGERLVGWAFRGHLLLSGKCLARSLVQYGLHRADGTSARFVVGVADERKAGLDAHAWVECIDDDRSRRHVPLMSSEFAAMGRAL